MRQKVLFDAHLPNAAWKSSSQIHRIPIPRCWVRAWTPLMPAPRWVRGRLRQSRCARAC